MPCRLSFARSIRMGDLASIVKARMIVLWSLCPVPGYPVSFLGFLQQAVLGLALLYHFCQLLAIPDGTAFMPLVLMIAW